ncbi:MAG: acylphosphatase [Candidatus Omnitrophota bacterium]
MVKKETKHTHRAHVFYSGRVQGVGFRYTAERLALELGLVGWVKNLPDNRVELVCEGSKEKIDEFLRRLTQELGSYVHKAACDWETPKNEFREFSVEFHL